MGCNMKMIPTSPNEWRAFFNREVGAIGIGSIIVFIAMVLVAGIAANVLIQTSGKLEMQAMKSGSETISEVATGIQVEGIDGYNVSGAGAISRLAIEIRTRAGSKEIDISETIIELTDSNTKNLFTYNSGNFTPVASINGNIFNASFYPFDNNTVFGVIVLEDGDDSITATNPVINSGDHVILTINITSAFGGFSTRIDVAGLVIPEDGSPGVISFTTPAKYTDAVVELQ
jgi:flagellin FlaB